MFLVYNALDYAISVAMSPDEKFIAFGMRAEELSGDKSLYVFNYETKEEVSGFPSMIDEGDFYNISHHSCSDSLKMCDLSSFLETENTFSWPII